MRKIIAVLLALCLTAGALPVLAEGSGGNIMTMLQEKMKNDLITREEAAPAEEAQADPGAEDPEEEDPTSLEEDPARVAVNLQAIKVMLDENELKFTYQEEQDSFLLKYSLESAMDAADVWLTAYDDGVWVRIDYEEEIPEDKWDQLMILCSLFNEDMRLGCFYVDRENASMGYRFFLYTDVLPPTQHALAFALVLGISMLEYRGDAVAAVLHRNMSAWEAYMAIE
ncbi:MAG: YbjN domain-containing protein [Clostridiales bacterium]|nr:YbjN domain-containing protein [Clostridiales bacterium]